MADGSIGIWRFSSKTDQAKAVALTRYLWWMSHDGQAQAKALGYAPLPAEIVAKVEEQINSITVDGQKAFPGK